MLGTWPLRKQRHTQRFVFLRPLWKHKTPGGNTLPTTYDTSVLRCAVLRCTSSVGANPTRHGSLQPVAIGAVEEATNLLKPLM